MNRRAITTAIIEEYGKHLQREERCSGTVEKYMRDVRMFSVWIGDRAVTKETAAMWKEHLLSQDYAPVTINSMLAALNGFFRYMDWEDCRLKFLKVQRRMFRESSRELGRAEYTALLQTAYSTGRERLGLLMETICASGIRVSEVQYITVEAAKKGRAEIFLKGKIRTILIPGKLARKLCQYAKKQKITSGEIFLTKGGRSLSRKQIWAEMKKLCLAAKVNQKKVFPHNLRHLFATAFYRVCKDIVKLADVLGHSSIETTRIYLLTSGSEHRAMLERLQLVQ